MGLEKESEGAEDAVIGVNNAAMLTSLGDLSPLMLELIDIFFGIKSIAFRIPLRFDEL